MKSNKVFIAMFLLTVMSSALPFARAEKAGNGGGVWTCRENGPSKAIRWVTLVDLFEGRKSFQLSIAHSSALSMEALIDGVERKIFQANKDFYAEFEHRLEAVRKNLKVVSDIEIDDLKDTLSEERPAPETCQGGTVQFEQLANYKPDGRILVDQRLWDIRNFGVVDQAALYVHEGIYKLLRDFEGSTDSRKARKIVAYLFSDAPVEIYANLLTLPKAMPTSSKPNSLDYQMGNILGDWEFFGSEDHFVLKVLRETDTRLKVYVCNAKIWQTQNHHCSYSALSFYSYDEGFGGFVSDLGKNFYAGFGIKVSGNSTRTLYHFYDPFMRYHWANSGTLIESSR